MNTVVALSEHVTQATLQADSVNAVLSGVKILGEHSLNTVPGTSQAGYDYPAATRSQAAPLYEGKPVYLDHGQGPGPRSVSSHIGQIVNVHEAGDGLRGDLRLLKSHPETQTLLERAKEMPETVALSHVVPWARLAQHQGRYVVDKIEEVASVDLVTKGGTTTSLYENAAPAPTPEDPRIASLTEALQHMTDSYHQVEARLQEAEKRETIDSLLREAHLPDGKTSPAFYQVLLESALPEAQRLIAERSRVSQAPRGPLSVGNTSGVPAHRLSSSLSIAEKDHLFQLLTTSQGKSSS